MRNTVLLIASVALATLAHADDAYSSFGANNLSNANSTYLLGANSLYDFGSEGFQFTATSTGTLTGLTAAIHNSTATTTLPITFSLYTDSANTLGTQLGSWSATASSSLGSASANSVAATAASGVSLTAGTAYWLVATNADTAVADDLFWNSATTVPTTSRRYALRSTVGSTAAPTAFYYMNNLGAFSVQVAPVATPEPTTLAVLGLGAAALLRRRRR